MFPFDDVIMIAGLFRQLINMCCQQNIVRKTCEPENGYIISVEKKTKGMVDSPSSIHSSSTMWDLLSMS